MKNWLTPLLLMGALCALTACTNTSKIISTGLSVELTQIEHRGDGTIQVTWRIKNPNVVSYLVDRAVHKVALDGALVGTIDDTSRLGVPPQSAADRTSVLTPANPQVAEHIMQLAAKGSASYQVESTISLLIYDDQISKSTLSTSGSVPVGNK